MNKVFMITIAREIDNTYLRMFVTDKLNMTFYGRTEHVVQYFSDEKPKNFKEKILKNFGKVTWKNIFKDQTYMWGDNEKIYCFDTQWSQ